MALTHMDHGTDTVRTNPCRDFWLPWPLGMSKEERMVRSHMAILLCGRSPAPAVLSPTPQRRLPGDQGDGVSEVRAGSFDVQLQLSLPEFTLPHMEPGMEIVKLISVQLWRKQASLIASWEIYQLGFFWVPCDKMPPSWLQHSQNLLARVTPSPGSILPHPPDQDSARLQDCFSFCLLVSPCVYSQRQPGS